MVGGAVPALLAPRGLPNGARMAGAASQSGGYPVYVGEGLLAADWWPLEGRRFCVTDTTVSGLYGAAIQPLAGQVDLQPGERAKSLAEAERVLGRSEEHTSELQSQSNLVCRLL